MSAPGSTVHPKLSDAAMAELRLIAESSGRTVQSVAEDILHRALLGESHTLKVAVERAIRAGVVWRGR